MEIRIEHQDTVTTVYPCGSITSANASEFETAFAEEPREAGGIVIDAADLEYISSAGLRVILSAKKRCGRAPFKIIHVNSEVMSIFDVTGFSEMLDIAAAARQVSVEGCTRIGAGACGECFRLDDETIVKLYYPHISKEDIETEKALAKQAFVMGVPTAISYDIVECDGRTGVMYELIKSKTLGELIRENPDHAEEYIDRYVEVCRQVHSIRADGITLPSFKDINRADIPKISYITEEERELLYRFIDLVPEDDTCLHGDLNINNIMFDGNECCLIDMGEFSTGLALFDISRIVFSMEYANDLSVEFNSFYKMPTKQVDALYRSFLSKYFGGTPEETAATYPNYRWLYPLAWFRCAASMLKPDRWPENMRTMALSLVRDKLIPFIRAEIAAQG